MKVLIDGKLIDVIIVRKSNRNTYVRVKPDLKIYISTNYLTSDNYIKKLIDSNIDYITNMYLKMKKRVDKSNKFYYLGKEYKVVITNAVKTPKISEDYIYTNKESDLNKFLDKKSIEVLLERVKYVYNKINIPIDYPKVNIRKMTRKWGYCNKSKGLITLNKELIKYDLDDIDYVIIHELVHFIHFDHSKEFWKLVKYYKPDYLKNKKHLNEE